MNVSNGNHYKTSEEKTPPGVEFPTPKQVAESIAHKKARNIGQPASDSWRDHARALSEVAECFALADIKNVVQGRALLSTVLSRMDQRYCSFQTRVQGYLADHAGWPPHHIATLMEKE